jgi:hypothetical protein
VATQSNLTDGQKYDLVVAYAAICTLPSIDSLAHQALTGAQTTVKNDAGTGTGTSTGTGAGAGTGTAGVAPLIQVAKPAQH